MKIWLRLVCVVLVVSVLVLGVGAAPAKAVGPEMLLGEAAFSNPYFLAVAALVVAGGYVIQSGQSQVLLDRLQSWFENSQAWGVGTSLFMMTVLKSWVDSGKALPLDRSDVRVFINDAVAPVVVGAWNAGPTGYGGYYMVNAPVGTAVSLGLPPAAHAPGTGWDRIWVKNWWTSAYTGTYTIGLYYGEALKATAAVGNAGNAGLAADWLELYYSLMIYDDAYPYSLRVVDYGSEPFTFGPLVVEWNCTATGCGGGSNQVATLAFGDVATLNTSALVGVDIGVYLPGSVSELEGVTQGDILADSPSWAVDVVANPAQAWTPNQSWAPWFDPLTWPDIDYSALEAIGMGSLGQAADTLGRGMVAGVNAVVTIPARITYAVEGRLTTWFTPSVNVWSWMGGWAGMMQSRFPLSLMESIAVCTSDVFEGADDAIDIALPTPGLGGGSVSLHIVPGSWVSPFKTLSAIVAYAFLLMYGVTVGRRFLGLGGSG